MDKYHLERREKIAGALALATLGAVAVWAKKEGKLGVARLYPGGSIFVDIIKEKTDEASTRLAYSVKSIKPLRLAFDASEPTPQELDEVADTFNIVTIDE